MIREDVTVDGAPVTIQLPDNSSTTGRISSFGTVASAGSNGQSTSQTGQGTQTATIPVYINLDHSTAAGRFDGAPVTVTFFGGTPVEVVTGATVRRTDRIDPATTQGIAVEAARPNLIGPLGGSVRTGTFLNAATSRYPAVVLGCVAAERLGITRPGQQVYIASRWFTVIRILNPLPLSPDTDRAALVGWEYAERQLDFDGHPTTIVERSTDASVSRVHAVLAATADPENPEDVQISRPSDALTAQLAAKSAFSALFLGLGAVALLVGGVGIANIMVISVLERRQEIGLRRALGATQGQIRTQFLTESVALSLLGGAAGALLGLVGTLAYAAYRGWPLVLPVQTLAGGTAAAIVVGAAAGIYPARRAARLTPTEALATG